MNPTEKKIKIVKKAMKPRIELLRCGSIVTKIEWLPGVKKPVVTYQDDYSFHDVNMKYLDRINRTIEG